MMDKIKVDKRKLVLLEAFVSKVKTFKQAFRGVDDTRIVLAIMFEVFNFIDALERLESELSSNRFNQIL